MTFSISQKLAAEGLGTAFLLAIVVGSGIMGDALSNGNDAIALLGNTIATGAGLYVLITIFGPVSGAHFNPAVTLAFLIRREISLTLAAAFVAVQIISGVIGVFAAHAMFDLEIMQQSIKARAGTGQALGEAVATFGLVLTILACVKFRPQAVAMAVGMFITAGYWFTSSTSFANPAVTIARTLTDTFAGIQALDAPAFLLAQFSAAALATGVAAWMFKEHGPNHA
ncbi:MAG: aquaporin family protein [Marinicaulis sp.]|nr:aquaporin family protein [Marinicaulis sp.]